MMILTAGDRKFRTLIKYSCKTAAQAGYPFFAYDLGGLGFGTPLALPRPPSTTCGHKPGMVSQFLQGTTHSLVVYLDGDAFLVDKIDEVAGDYDIGITVRREEESEVSSLFGWLNAGVMFFYRSALPFLARWREFTDRLHDDQLAFNQLINPQNTYIRPNQTLTVHGAKIRTFPTDVYNFYYFPEKPQGAKILHFRSNNWGFRHDYIPLSVL